MARPLSDEKRSALLAAAIDLFSENGIDSTPTAAISKAAGVAEGSLFTYFKSKDGLVNALYLELKAEVAQALLKGFPRDGSIAKKLRHLWDRHVAWCAGSPKKMKTLERLLLSNRLGAAARAEGAEPFRELDDAVQRAVEDGTLRDLSMPYLHQIFAAMVTATLQMIATDPAGAARYRREGFEILWNAVRR
jgi:AcrR family transcriptional regulator